ncbi:PVC-type heme-binding CxxCH protein [Candidatus Laterigemmans baculatus]|uniref:PVC-type heme-binding CxxCH protein n=1 Tax=Candidatus Laterigemmans baculatus TaxID=2770505 RepID=UPI0013DC5AC4|nr:PVC-type heme-binding CxxCH protein [Candidatus Laterigemmans baculatus]
MTHLSVGSHLGSFFLRRVETPARRLLARCGSALLMGLGTAVPLAAAELRTPEITVPEGFTVERVAAPPLVQHPTMACFDDRGRLFVCESAGLNLDADTLEAQTPNSIRLLEDRDGDGRFDHATVFADKMTFPMGAAWHEGALYVASPPNIWRLEDSDGDGVADKREILVDKFGFTGNAASIHGCFLAPDGRLYWCDGYHGHEFRNEAGEITSKRVGSYIFSCRPDGSDVQIHAGGGMDNPVEVDFSEAGDVLGTVNILYTRPRVDALVHWLYGGAYPHRSQVLEELKVTGDLLGPVHSFGHVAVSGMMRYRSDSFDLEGRDVLFATFFNTGQVAKVELAPQGSTYQAIQRPFLSSSDRDFHPTDVLEDADGSLLVIDTGGWFYRGCPTSQFSKPDVLGGIYRVRREGAAAVNYPWGSEIEWAQLSPEQCLERTGDPRFRVRERATAELAGRGAAALPALQTAIESGSPQTRLAAVWALSRIVQAEAMQRESMQREAPAEDAPSELRSQALAALRAAVDDSEPTVRQAACHSLATHRDAAALPQLIVTLQQDDRPAVRRVAAQALGRIGSSEAVPALLQGLEQAVDRAERHALVYALIEIDDAEATAQAFAGLEPSELSQRAASVEGALNALDQMDHGQLDGAFVTSLLDAESESLRRTALRILQRRPEWAELAAATLNELLTASAERPDRSDVIEGLITNLIRQPSVIDQLGKMLSAADPESERTQFVLQAIAQSNLDQLPAEWQKPLGQLLQSDNDPRTLALAIGAVGAIRTDRFDEQLRAIGGDESLSRQLRVAAYEAVSGRGNQLSPELFSLLLEMLGPTGTPAEASQASRTIASASLTSEQLQDVLPLLEQAGPMQLADLMTPFTRTRDVETGRAFLTAIERSRGFGGLAATTFSDTIKQFPQELLPQANRLLDRLEADHEQKVAKLDSLLPLVAKGNLERGERLFFSEKAKCSSCHRVGNRGELIGPDLTTIGANRATVALLESTVFPSASIVRDYEPVKVLTVDGRLLTGIVVDQTAEAVTVQQQTGKPLQIPRDEIEVIEASTVSLMPAGLEDALNEQELADIIAYLSSLR